jgi:hypothetical protein
MRRPVARLSLTKPMLQPALTRASCSGSRSETGRLAFRHLRTDRFAYWYRRRTRLWFTPAKFWAQQVVDAPVAESPAHVGDLDELGTQGLVHLALLGWVRRSCSGRAPRGGRHGAGPGELIHHGCDRHALGLWG